MAGLTPPRPAALDSAGRAQAGNVQLKTLIAFQSFVLHLASVIAGRAAMAASTPWRPCHGAQHCPGARTGTRRARTDSIGLG
jgi:hypothetical protein